MNGRITIGWIIRKMLVATIGFVLGLLLLVALAAGSSSPKAHSDTTDDIYLLALHQHGIHLSDTDMELKLGHAVCTDLENGKGLVPESAHLAAIWTDPSLTLDQASWIVGAASASYCAWENPFVDDDTTSAA